MPILLPHQEQASGAGPSAGITFGITFGGILLLSLVIFVIFLLRRRNQRNHETARRRNGTLFDSGSDEAKDSLMEKQDQSSHSDQPPPPSHLSSTSLLTSPDSSSGSRPLVPRITIPQSPPLMKSGFMDQHGSAVQSACMDSSESAYSQFSASSHSATLHAVTARHFPSHTQHSAAQPYGLTTSDVAAATRPLVTLPRPRRSLHPFSGANLITVPDASRMHMEAIMELPSPFIFGAGPAAAADPPRRDTLPVSPMSKLSEELDEFIETLPAPLSAAQQSPETPASAAYGFAKHSSVGHVSPLQIRKAQ